MTRVKPRFSYDPRVVDYNTEEYGIIEIEARIQNRCSPVKARQWLDEAERRMRKGESGRYEVATARMHLVACTRNYQPGLGAPRRRRRR